jgi:ketosteroid isomerase-like protein
MFTDTSSGRAKVTESALPIKGNKNLERTFLLCTPQGAPIATGKGAIRKFWASLLARPGFAASFGSTKVEVAAARDLAYEEGTYLLTTNDSNGKPHVQKGKYVVVWKKQADGKWKAVVDIFNTDE